MSIHKDLANIQKKLNAPKNQVNKFGGYNYRSCEDILEEIKRTTACSVTLCDDLVKIGDRYYIKSTACLVNFEGESVCTTAFARESEARKGMSDDQLTGSCSSYARKYALNGLFAIDDSKDSDARASAINGLPQESIKKNMDARAAALNEFSTKDSDTRKLKKPPYSDKSMKENMEAWGNAIESGNTAGGIINMIKQRYSLSPDQEMEILGIKV